MDKLPLLIYDGDCGFCEKSARLVQRLTKQQTELQAWQNIPDRMAALGLTDADGMTQVWYFSAEKLTGGAEAVNAALHPVWWLRPLTALYPLPGIRQIEDYVYRWVANNRYRMPGSTPACAINPPPTNE